MERLSVSIIGGGIGGLTAALAMRRIGFDAVVYERAPEILPIGGGISLWPNGVKVLDWLGVGEELERHAGQMSFMRYRTSEGDLLADLSLTRLADACGRRPFPVTRTDLQSVLLDAVGMANVRLGYECVAVNEVSDRPVVWFANGESVSSDLVIAADGIRSATRSFVDPDCAPVYAGNVNWNGLVASDPQLETDDAFTIFVGEMRRIGMMPMGHGRTYYFFDAPLDAGASVDRDQWGTELAELFGHWAPPVRKLLERIDWSIATRVEVSDLMPPPSKVFRGRVVLIGDAAHAATPTLGQGAAQAIEDCEILSRFLKTTSYGVEDALRRYEDVRRPRTHDILQSSRMRSRLMMGADPAATEQWYRDLRGTRTDRVVDDMIAIANEGPMG